MGDTYKKGFIDAARKGDLRAVNKVLYNSAVLADMILRKPNNLGNALVDAATKGHDKIVSAILTNYTAFDYISKQDQHKIAAALLAACEKGNDKCVAEIVNISQSFYHLVDNHLGEVGRSLIKAAEVGSAKCIDAILNHDIALSRIIKDTPDNLGKALHQAATKGSAKCVAAILDNEDALRAIIRAEDGKHLTRAFEVAVDECHLEYITTILHNPTALKHLITKWPQTVINYFNTTDAGFVASTVLLLSKTQAGRKFIKAAAEKDDIVGAAWEMLRLMSQREKPEVTEAVQKRIGAKEPGL